MTKSQLSKFFKEKKARREEEAASAKDEGLVSEKNSQYSKISLRRQKIKELRHTNRFLGGY